MGVILLNSVPKSGTHLLRQIMRPVGEPCPVHPEGHISTGFHGFGLTPSPVQERIQGLQDDQGGSICYGHLTYHTELDTWLRERNAKMIFLYRSVFDSAVSLRYHILNPDQRFKAFERKRFNLNLTTQEQLASCFNFMFFTWLLYRKWMTSDWVLPVRFKELREAPEETCERILAYLGMESKVEVADMVDSIHPEGSPTFRAGRVGDWLDEDPIGFTVWFNMFKEKYGVIVP